MYHLKVDVKDKGFQFLLSYLPRIKYIQKMLPCQDFYSPEI